MSDEENISEAEGKKTATSTGEVEDESEQDNSSLNAKDGEDKSVNSDFKSQSQESVQKQENVSIKEDASETSDEKKPSQDCETPTEVIKETLGDENESTDLDVRKSSTEPEQKDSEITTKNDDHKPEEDYVEVKKEPSEDETDSLDSDAHKSSDDSEVKKELSEDETESLDLDGHISLSDIEMFFDEDSTAEDVSETSEDKSSQESDSPARVKRGSFEDESFDSDRKSSSDESVKTLETNINQRLRNLFARPKHAEPRHPVFSSPFARHISKVAFGPKKPRWYLPLTSIQLYLFKDIMNCVEIGRRGLFHFEEFLEALQDFDPSVTRAEVLDIFDSMERNEFEELDFGKFLFLLAYRDPSSERSDSEDVEELLHAPLVTPRQCLILSAIAYYVLIASPEEIERYYIENTRRKATILNYHMEASRLGGLTEKQMEEKQKKAMERLGPLFAVTGSPYAYPVPFVPRFRKNKLFKEWTNRRVSRPKSAIPMLKKPVSRPIKTIQQSRELGDPYFFETKEDRTYYDMHYGRLPWPHLRIPKEMRMEMRKKCTVEFKDYITRKAYEAKKEYRDDVKKATVLYNIRSLETILNKGFPTTADRDAFIETYLRYMPLSLKDVHNFSLWVKPAGYGVKHDGKPLYPDKFAFGSKIP